MSYNLIGIAGCKRSGKDTVARIIQAINIYKEHNFKDLKLVDESTFIHNCLSNEYFQKINSAGYYSDYETHAFADNLKFCVSFITGINFEDLFDETIKDSSSGIGDLTVRQLLQRLGTEVCRAIDSDVWVKSLFKDFCEQNKWIVTDVRFKNEADYIVKKGGILIRVNRNNITNEHSSETGLVDYPSISEDIMNTGSMDELIDKVKNIMIKYKL